MKTIADGEITSAEAEVEAETPAPADAEAETPVPADAETSDLAEAPGEAEILALVEATAARDTKRDKDIKGQS